MTAKPQDFSVTPKHFPLPAGASQRLDVRQDVEREEADGQSEPITVIYRLSADNDLHFELAGGRLVKGVMLNVVQDEINVVEAPPDDQHQPTGIEAPIELEHRLVVKKGDGNRMTFYSLQQRIIDAGLPGILGPRVHRNSRQLTID